MTGIRTVVLEDAAAILAIYAPYILNTSITFEYEVPTLEEFTARIDRIRTTHPYLVYVEEGKVIGYAYATKFRERAAYQWDAELSVYLNQECRGRGVGRKLYSALRRAGKRNGTAGFWRTFDCAGGFLGKPESGCKDRSWGCFCRDLCLYAEAEY